MAPVDLQRRPRVPRRPTAAELRHRRRRAGALAVVAALALLVGLIAGASSGDDASGDHAEATKVGWYGHLRMLAGNGERSLDFEQRAQESEAIDRTLALSPFVRKGGSQHRLVALTFDDGPGPATGWAPPPADPPRSAPALAPPNPPTACPIDRITIDFHR